jgi:phage shock protein C
MAVYCKSCGKALGDDARFCSACGQPVGGVVYSARPGLIRPRAGRKVAGVCQGLANHLGWDVTLLRVITVILSIVTFPLGIIAYLIFWLVVPEEPLPVAPVTIMHS